MTSSLASPQRLGDNTSHGSQTFWYWALHPDGEKESGTLRASSRELAITYLKERGLLPLEVRVQSGLHSRRTALPPADLALGLRILSDLLDAGLPMRRALTEFADLAPKSWGMGLEPLQQSIREGQSVVQALDTSGLAFPPLVLGIIQAGEASGGLATAIRRAADFTEASAATRNAIRAALAYPLILGIAGIGAIGLLVGVVLPKFADILADMGQALPSSTQIVMSVADTLRARAGAILAGGVLLFIIWRLWTASAQGQRQWHHLLLSLPLIGPLRHRTATAHATAALASLLDTGVPLPVALEHAARATGDGAVEARLREARARVLTGQRLGTACAKTNALTITGTRLIRTGEETGRLTDLLRHAAKIESTQAQYAVKAFVRVLEPALILLFGALVAFVAAVLLQAIYSVGPAS